MNRPYDKRNKNKKKFKFKKVNPKNETILNMEIKYEESNWICEVDCRKKCKLTVNHDLIIYFKKKEKPPKFWTKLNNFQVHLTIFSNS